MDIDHTRLIPAVRSVALVIREGGAALAAAKKLQASFESRGIGVLFADEDRLGHGGVGIHTDLMIALGGDGTMLRALRASSGNMPVIGVNFGTLGFLTVGGPELLDKIVEAACAGELICEPRIRLLAAVHRGEKLLIPPGTQYAYNDVVIKVGSNPRLLDLHCELGGRRLAKYKADGLIVSTPLGSTAYNLAAHGPIVCPDAAAYTVTPLNAHGLTHRPVVVAAGSRCSVTLLGPENTDAVLSIDGSALVLPLQVGDRVSIAVDTTISYVVPPDGSVFDALRARLGYDFAS